MDPKGYYRILDVAETATAAEIKAAFRRKAMELHPDRNDARGATEAFQRLNEAYSVLSEPERRAQYDTATFETEARPATAGRERPEPIACSECGKVTAQPRYVIFHEVKSFIVMTQRTPLQGIFCSACAEKKALRATLVTWLLGWWGIPWGPIYSVQALAVNLFGGRQPADINARLAAHQAWAFAAAGHGDLAAAIARDAIRLATKVKPDRGIAETRRELGYAVDSEGPQLKASMEALLSALHASPAGPHLKESWGLWRRPFFVQAVVALTAIGVTTGLVLTDSGPSTSQPTSYAYSRAPPAGPQSPAGAYSEVPPAEAERPAFVRPALAPNGSPWPISAGYVAGYKKLRMQGLSIVTVDNSQNDADVFVKLVFLDPQEAYPVRIFFIPASGSFTVRDVNPGQYDVRYRDLSDGGLARSEPFTLEEIEQSDGTQYSDVTMTLYKVVNGNMQTYAISEEEF